MDITFSNIDNIKESLEDESSNSKLGIILNTIEILNGYKYMEEKENIFLGEIKILYLYSLGLKKSNI